MLRQSSSRSHRNKVLRVKHVLQISLLVAVCFWLLYQLKHSYYKKKAFVDENSEISSKVEEQQQQRFVKLGRKDLPRNEEANLREEEEKEQEAVKHMMEEEEEIGEEERARGNEREDEERENEGEDTDDRGRGEASRVAREDRELEYEENDSDEEKFVGDDDNDGDVGSTIDDGTNFGEGNGDGDGDGDGDSNSLLKKTVPDDNSSTNGVGSNQNESIVANDHDHQIAASINDTDNSVAALQNQTFNLESIEEEKHVSVKREIDEEKESTMNNSSFTIEQEDSGEHSTVSAVRNDVEDVNKIVADARLDLSTLPVIRGEVVKAEEDAAE